MPQSYNIILFQALVDYEGDSEEEDEETGVSTKQVENEQTKASEPTLEVPSPSENDDNDAESPNKRAKLT